MGIWLCEEGLRWYLHCLSAVWKGCFDRRRLSAFCVRSCSGVVEKGLDRIWFRVQSQHYQVLFRANVLQNSLGFQSPHLSVLTIVHPQNFPKICTFQFPMLTRRAQNTDSSKAITPEGMSTRPEQCRPHSCNIPSSTNLPGGSDQCLIPNNTH